MTPRRIVVAFILLSVTGQLEAGDGVQLEAARSVFAVITRKGGFAAGLAHDHLVSASKFTVDLQFDEASPLETSMDFAVAAEDLAIDDPDLRDFWHPRLKELGILDELPGNLTEKDRRKIRGAMLGKRQLAAESHPTLRARIVLVQDSVPATEGSEFSYLVGLALTVRDTTVTEIVKARFENRSGTIKIEAYGTFRFTDFGIKPYSGYCQLERDCALEG
jgi:hypothetical protein